MTTKSFISVVILSFAYGLFVGLMVCGCVTDNENDTSLVAGTEQCNCNFERLKMNIDLTDIENQTARLELSLDSIKEALARAQFTDGDWYSTQERREEAINFIIAIKDAKEATMEVGSQLMGADFDEQRRVEGILYGEFNSEYYEQEHALFERLIEVRDTFGTLVKEMNLENWDFTWDYIRHGHTPNDAGVWDDAVHYCQGNCENECEKLASRRCWGECASSCETLQSFSGYYWWYDRWHQEGCGVIL